MFYVIYFVHQYKYKERINVEYKFTLKCGKIKLEIPNIFDMFQNLMHNLPEVKQAYYLPSSSLSHLLSLLNPIIYGVFEDP